MAEGRAPRPGATFEPSPGDPAGRSITVLPERRTFSLPERSPATPAKPSMPSAAAVSPDGGTLFVGYPDDKAVWAFRVGADGKATAGAPYCPLRARKGREEAAVTGLAVDAKGYVYAATADGVQFFDPTGRFSGLMAPPAAGGARQSVARREHPRAPDGRRGVRAEDEGTRKVIGRRLKRRDPRRK